MKLLLDDIRTPKIVFLYKKDIRYLDTDWVIVRNFTQFKRYIEEKPMPELVSFDHDLSFEHYEIDFKAWKDHSSLDLDVEETGYDCAKFLTNYCMKNQVKLPDCLCHSMNPVGRDNILNLIYNYRRYLDV